MSRENDHQLTLVPPHRRAEPDVTEEGCIASLQTHHHVGWESHHLRRTWRLGVRDCEAF